MKILAIDSSSMVASVAITDENVTIAEYTINSKKTHSQTLLPMIEDMIKKSDMEKDEIDAIAIAGGPGSFTGLRIGSATAKGIGLALDKPIINVPTMDALAYNLYGVDGFVCPIMDARREQVYTGIYAFDDNKFNVVMEQTPLPLTELIGILNKKDRKVTFIGDGVSAYREIIEKNINVPYFFSTVNMNRNRAASVAALALEYAKEGKFETAAEHCPDYMRMSQAERERKEREANETIS